MVIAVIADVVVPPAITANDVGRGGADTVCPNKRKKLFTRYTSN
jgi:hypothetical protein